jgi:KaiC/GvpD/RAD55 family RecA-like ATPase
MSPKKKVGVERIAFGIPGFDSMIEGGVEKNSVIMIVGGSGTGKTTFCTQTLHNAAHNGSKCLYISFEEPTDQIIRHATSFCDKCKNEGNKNLVFKKVDIFEVAKSVEASILKAKGDLMISDQNLPFIIPPNLKPDMIVVDSLPALSSLLKEDAYRYFIFKFFTFLKTTGSTVLIISEKKEDPGEFGGIGIEEYLGDGIIILYNIRKQDVRIRAVEVIKMRGSQHKEGIVPFKLTEKGIEVYPDQNVFA